MLPMSIRKDPSLAPVLPRGRCRRECRARGGWVAEEGGALGGEPCVLFASFFFKQKTAYEISCDWSSDVCSSDRSEEHTSELQSHDNLVCRLIRSEEHTSELHTHDNT